MLLQLWGDLASQQNLSNLRGGAIVPWSVSPLREERSSRDTSVRGQTGMKLAIFSFSRLRPDFSYSCESLVLNTTRHSEIREVGLDSGDARDIADAFQQAGLDQGKVHHGSREGKPHLCAQSWPMKQALCPGVPVSPTVRMFASVNELVGEESFSGVAKIEDVVVRKVEAWGCPAGKEKGDIYSTEAGIFPTFPPSHGTITLFLGDPWKRRIGSADAGVEATARVRVEGGALQNLLGGIPRDILRGSSTKYSREEKHNPALEKVASRIVRSFLEGLEAGGRDDERMSVELACMTSVDENGMLLRGGTSYRLINVFQCPL